MAPPASRSVQEPSIRVSRSLAMNMRFAAGSLFTVMAKRRTLRGLSPNAIAHETRSKVAREIDGRRHAAEAQLSAKLSDTEKHIADVKRIALDHVSTIATETTEAVVEALVGKVSRDEAAAAVAAVSVGKH